MSVSTEPGADSSRTAGENTLRKQLDALAAGKIDNATFLRNTLQRFRINSDESWEVLSLLDQYHRLGKIKTDSFREIKTKIAEYAMGSMIDVSATSDGAMAPVAVATPVAPIAPDAPAVSVQPPTPPPIAAPIPQKLIPEVQAPALLPAREQSVSQGSVRDTSKQSTSVKSTAPPEPPRDPRVGDTLRRRYRLESILGTGTMGTVFEASDPLRLDVPPLGQRMAIKVLHSAVAKRLELLQELRREFQDLQMLSHPNILRAYEFDRDGPLAFFTMEVLSGITLARLLSARQQGPPPRDLALAMIRDLASAVDHAHSHNLLHGDINPQNVFITTRGGLRLLNFGKALRTGISPIQVEEEPLMISSATPGYASCQVLEGDQRSVQDDLFSLACLACLILSGQHPYRGNSAIEARAMNLRPRRPRGLSHGQWSALRAALHFERKRRPPDIATWMAQFDLRGAVPRLPPVGEMIEARAAGSNHLVALAAIAAVVVAVAATYWMATQNRRPPPDSNATRGAVVAQSAATPPPEARVAVAAKTPAPAPPPAQIAAPTPTPADPAPKPVESNIAVEAPPAVAPTASPAEAPAAAPPGRTKVEMIADTLEAPPGVHVVQVIVRRRGSLRGETRFNWWTESGTAKPGTDFVAVLPRIERVEEGQSSATLTIAVTDVLRAQPKSFYVVIDEAEGGATLNGRRLTMVTLQ